MNLEDSPGINAGRGLKLKDSIRLWSWKAIRPALMPGVD